MVFSMTGYAFFKNAFSTDESEQESQISCEIKSVNSRFLDLSIFLPPFCAALEPKIRNLVCQKVSRGKIDIFFRVKNHFSQKKISADIKTAKSIYDEAKKIAFELGFSEQSIPLSFILSQEGVFNFCCDDCDEENENFSSELIFVLEKTLEQFLKERSREGKNLETDILSHLFVLEECANFFENFSRENENFFKDFVREKFIEITKNNFDEAKILSETATLIIKYTINEEIVRLKSHLYAMRTELTAGGVIGKRLDFLCQEIGREINTIGSKSPFFDLSQKVIQAKDALENIREQARNVE